MPRSPPDALRDPAVSCTEILRHRRRRLPRLRLPPAADTTHLVVARRMLPPAAAASDLRASSSSTALVAWRTRRRTRCCCGSRWRWTAAIRARRAASCRRCSTCGSRAAALEVRIDHIGPFSEPVSLPPARRTAIHGPFAPLPPRTGWSRVQYLALVHLYCFEVLLPELREPTGACCAPGPPSSAALVQRRAPHPTPPPPLQMP